MEVTRRGVVSGVLAVVLGVAVLGLIAIVVFPIPLTTAHTEFYVLGEAGQAADYPSNLSVGEEGTVTVGITNNEHREVTYRLVVESNESSFVDRRVTVERGETWEEDVSFSFENEGERTVELLLYKGGEEEVYRELYLRVEVDKRR